MKLLPKGHYTVELQRIDDGEGAYGPYWRWVCTTTHQNRTYTLSVFTSQKTGPESRARAYAEAFYGESLEGQEVDVYRLPGDSCTAEVRIISKNGRQFNAIENLF